MHVFADLDDQGDKQNEQLQGDDLPIAQDNGIVNEDDDDSMAAYQADELDSDPDDEDNALEQQDDDPSAQRRRRCYNRVSVKRIMIPVMHSVSERVCRFRRRTRSMYIAQLW